MPRLRWHLDSSATIRNPAAPGNLQQAISADILLRPQLGQTIFSQAWKYVYSRQDDGNPLTCDETINNNPGIVSSFYVRGDLCLDNSSSFYGPQNPGDPAVDVVVKGNIYLNHPSVSRQHLVVRRSGDQFFVRDCGSHNGSFLNGRTIRGEQELFSGDELTLGRVVLVMRSTAPMVTGRTVIPAPIERTGVKLAIFGGAALLGVALVLVFARAATEAMQSSHRNQCLHPKCQTRLLELFAALDWDPDYDYKRERSRKQGFARPREAGAVAKQG